MKTTDVQKLYREYILPTYVQLPFCPVKGKGARLWDLHGKVYIDFFPGWAVSGLGHCYPAVVNAIKDQARKLIHIPNNYLNLKQAQLAREISRAAFPARVFFCNSGAEATEAAIKYARKYGADTGRYEIISMRHSFHGRTFAAIAATGQDKVQKGFDPQLAGFRYAEFNNLESVRQMVTDKTIAVFLEPVQGEGGVRVARRDFMTGLRQLCDEKGLLLILDEVQTGMGRTGKMFAFEHYGIEPDLMTLAKSLGSGVPIGALVVNNKIKKEVLTPGTHGSTYGGNPLVASAALAVFRTIRKKRLLSAAVQLGDYLGRRLVQMKDRYPVIREVRGLAMMRAIELNEPGAPFVDLARAKGLLINCTQETVLRIMPPLTISKRLLEEGLRILEEVFEELK